MTDDRPKLNWLRVRDPSGLDRIAKFVTGQRVNTYTTRPDKNGDPILMLGWDDKPDSDWGKFRGNSAAIWFASRELADEGERYVRRALKWPDEEPAIATLVATQ